MNRINSIMLQNVKQNQNTLRAANGHIEFKKYNDDGTLTQDYQELTVKQKQDHLHDLCEKCGIKRVKSFLLDEQQTEMLQEAIPQIEYIEHEPDYV